MTASRFRPAALAAERLGDSSMFCYLHDVSLKWHEADEPTDPAKKGSRSPRLLVASTPLLARLSTGLVLALACAGCLMGKGSAAEKTRPAESVRFSGMADASAGLAVGTNYFLAASDEDNTIRLYRRDSGGPPVKGFDLDAQLPVSGKVSEMDLEGAARIGSRAFWIGSHGRNREGKIRENRRLLFATEIRSSEDLVGLEVVGRPYRDLLEDLERDKRFASFQLLRASRLEPKEKGALNIEGLAQTEGEGLLIGFRNPIPGKKALLIPLRNPNQVILGKAAQFGDPILLDLDDRGIRDIAFCEGRYLILAGSYHGGGKFGLYEWKGGGSTPKLMASHGFKHFTPEAIVVYPDFGLSKVQILSDDGNLKVLGQRNKDMRDPSQRTFRGFWLRLESP